MLTELIDVLKTVVALYGAPGLFSVMALQAIVAPIPSDVIIISAVLLGMNPIAVVVSGGLGSTIGGLIGFQLARRGGRPLAVRMVGKKWMARIDKCFERWGIYFLIFGRAAPFFSSDAIAYAAGVTRMRPTHFFPFALVGGLLRCAILVLVGDALLALIPLMG